MEYLYNSYTVLYSRLVINMFYDEENQNSSPTSLARCYRTHLTQRIWLRYAPPKFALSGELQIRSERYTQFRIK